MSYLTRILRGLTADQKSLTTSEQQPMFNSIRKLGAVVVILTSLGLAGCGGSDVSSGTAIVSCSLPQIPNAAGSSCVAPPPLSCTAPLVPAADNQSCVIGADPSLPIPSVFPSATQAVVYYNRALVDATNESGDTAYEGYRLHTWNNDTCDSLAPDSIAPSWDNGLVHDGIDPNYGAYWLLNLKEGFGTCHNFIIHIGTDDAGKEMGGADFRAPLDQEDDTYQRVNFTLSGEPTVFDFPILSLGERPVQIEGLAAHWLDANTLVWNAPDAVTSVKLHYSANAGIEASLETGLNGTALDLVDATLTDEQIAIAPHLASMSAFAGEWDADAAKAVLKTQTVLGGYNDEGKLVAATGIQIANALDTLYTMGDVDADEATLGLSYDADMITSNVWAPTAQNVVLNVYGADKRLASSHQMTEDPMTGIWSYSGTGMDRMFYRFAVTVFHPVSGEVQTFDVTDPYSVGLGVNGRFSQFVNLSDADLKPDGWDDSVAPTITNPEDAVIYEGHVRDFSALDMSTSAANRGKYLAFTEENTAPVNHLMDLVDAGITHFHVLPVNDIATIEERPERTVDMFDTVFDLCLLNRDAAVCDEESPTTVLKDLFESYDPFLQPTKAQELAQMMRNVDDFNWGYDPKHFNAPEGSYATDPDGVARILEMRSMVQALHTMGLRVAIDVVYNHTNASGLNDNSVLDKVVPGYYHRYTVDVGNITRNTCCDDTEDRNRMMAKLMEDSLVMWATQYKYDAFRFDLMGHHSKDVVLALETAVKAVDSDTYFYGEGWTAPDRGVTQADQINLAGSQIGTFNDRIREAIRGGAFFNGLGDGDQLYAGDRIKAGLAGTLNNYILQDSNGVTSTTSSLGGYAVDPADIINYVSKHDGETLWDKFNYELPGDLSLAQRVRAQNIGLGLPLMAQGIPFLQMGGDLLRSKSMDRNTYDAGDWFNKIDFTKQSNNFNVGLPLAQDNQGAWETIGSFAYSPERAASMSDVEFAGEVFQELLSIRADSPLFRLTTGEDILARVGFHNIGRSQAPGVIAMSIDDSAGMTDIDPMNDALMVIVNASYDEQSVRVNTATGFALHATQASSIDSVVRGASFAEGDVDNPGNGLFTVPAQTIAVFVKAQGTEQGMGISAFATAGAPDVVPYGSTVVYLRGSMNDWGTATEFNYEGDGIYRATYTLEAGTEYNFKVANADWDNPNLGGQAGQTAVTEAVTYSLDGGENLQFTPADTALYEFIFDAADMDNQTLLISKDNPFFGTEVYLRGGMNDWGTANEMVYVGDKVFTAYIDVAAGDYEFKVASDDWSTVDFGAPANTDEARNMVPGDVFDTSTGGGDNFRLAITDTEEYAFIFDTSGMTNTIAVFKSQFFGATPVYLRGGMNGWGTDNQFIYSQGEYSVTLDVSAGSVEFKVADADWANINIGAVDGDNKAVTLGAPLMMLQGSNDNLVLDAPATGSYTFTVRGPNPLSPTVTVTQN